MRMLYSAVVIVNCVSKNDLPTGIVPELGNKKIQKKITKGAKINKFI